MSTRLEGINWWTPPIGQVAEPRYTKTHLFEITNTMGAYLGTKQALCGAVMPRESYMGRNATPECKRCRAIADKRKAS